MKFKPYPKYKKSRDGGITVINMNPSLPNSWNIHKLKFLLRKPVTDGPHETPEFIDEGIPFLSVDSIQDGKLVFENCRYISEEDYLRYKQKCDPQKNDILMGKAASIGKIAIVDVDFEFSTWSPLALLRPNQSILPKFLEYSFKSDYCQDQIDLYATSNTQKNISMDEIPRIQIITPTIQEQNNITDFLDKQTAKIDALIEKDKKLIALLKEKRTALINHAVTKGLDQNVKFKDSGVEWIGEIPEGWVVRRLNFLTSKINSGVTPKGGAEVYTEEGIPLLRSQNIHFEGLKLEDVAYIPEEIHKTMSNSVVKNRDVLINITGASIGRCTYVDGEFEKANVNQHVCIIRPKKIDYKYLTYFLRSKHGQDQVFSIQMGSSREGLNFEQLGNFVVPFTPISVQIAIASYLDKATAKIDKTIQKINKNIELLEEYKKSLIHHVVTGKVDVRGVEA
ncbi:Type-1 restriction enzyme MjaXIP specificity protein [ANME-1 cluster archaeon GoMg1]|nr:Type-1 restriction enzyme MjaXIP specificity protein [ANME-1 cluster archaeon GoMg1]